MTVGQLIEKLESIDLDKIIILTDPDGIGWDNVGEVIEEDSTVKITMDGNPPFQN